MEAVFFSENLLPESSLKEVMATFFKSHTPDSAKLLFWKLFQCWAIQDCKIKSDVSDEEIALFFDQLIDLVAAAHIIHEANRAPEDRQEGDEHE